MLKKSILSFVVIILSVVAINAQSKLLSAGTPAPTFSLPGLDGERVSLRTWCGDTLAKPHLNKYRHIVVLSFWATYCKPCLRELPLLVNFASRHVQDSVKVLYINIDKEGSDLVDPFLKGKNLAVPTLLDQYTKTSQRYGVKALPALFVIDPMGIVRYSSVGYDSASNLDSRLEQIVTALRGQGEIPVGGELSSGEKVSVNSMTAEQSNEPLLQQKFFTPNDRWNAVVKMECGVPITTVANEMGVNADSLNKWNAQLKRAADSVWGKQ